MNNQSIKNGFTLLEMVASISIIGIIAIAGIARFGFNAATDFGSQAGAKQLALSMLQAKRRAISTGDNHYISLTTQGTKIVSYQLYRRTGSGDVAVDDLVTFEKNLTVTSASSTVEFDFAGEALATATITLIGPNRTWKVEVIAVTGFAKVSEVP